LSQSSSNSFLIGSISVVETKSALPPTPSSLVSPMPIKETSSGLTQVPSSFQVKYDLLQAPGLSLRNSVNKCWFHSSLQLLSTIPLVRRLTATLDSKEGFYLGFKNALTSIVERKDSHLVAKFFHR